MTTKMLVSDKNFSVEMLPIFTLETNIVKNLLCEDFLELLVQSNYELKTILYFSKKLLENAHEIKNDHKDYSCLVGKIFKRILLNVVD